MFSRTILSLSSLIKAGMLVLFFLLVAVEPVRATHIVGGEIYYKYLGNDKYKITLIVYRDCYNGVPGLDNPAWVSVFNNNPSYSWKDTLIIPLAIDTTIPPAISSPCLVPPVNVCYEIGTYVDTVTLPPSANGYWLVYQRCCRNHTIKNIVNPNQTGATYTAFIPGTTTFSQNSNPVFRIVPPTYSFICLNTPFVFDHSAYDTDTNALGQLTDSLVYSLCNPYDYEGFFNNIPQPTPPFQPPYSVVNWQSPYSLSNLLGGVPLIIDQHTGKLTCTPNDTGQYVFSVCVQEFRNGVYLSTTRRDYQLNVVPCPDITVAALQSPILNCDDLSVTFSNQSVNAFSYHWDFGDPSTNADTSNQFSPTYVYPDTGEYNVLLVAYSALNVDCNDSATSVVNVYPGYKIGIAATKTPCSPEVYFNDSIFSGVYNTAKWNWDFGDGTTANVADPIHRFPGPGSYIVKFFGMSNKGCVDSMSLTIDLKYLKADISNTVAVRCFGECNGSASVSTINGIVPITYQWDDPLLQTTPTAANLCKGNYKVIIKDSLGCRDTVHVSINQPPPLAVTVKSNNDYCNHSCVGLADATITGGNGGYNYHWNDPQNQTTSVASGLCNGLYSFTATDSKGCTINDSVVVNYVDSLPFVAASADQDTIYLGQQSYIHATQSNGYIYSWSPSSTLSSSTDPNPLSTPLQTTTYQIQVTDSNGCKIKSDVTIWVRDVLCQEPEIFIPNAFTPNSDHQNDVLYVRGNTMKELYFVIYDRWGEKVFETNDQHTGWDGTYKGKKLAPAVFDYYIKAVCYDKSVYNHKGNITLLR